MLPVPVYADTSVYGGAFDEEFRAPGLAFFDQVRRGYFTLVTSALVAQEMAAAPVRVRELFQSLTTPGKVLEVTEPALRLRRGYLEAGIVTEKSLADALHVALASVADCPLIVSWNFKHIVHFQKIPMYNAVNTLQGFHSIAIHSPQEVLHYEDQNL